MKKNILTAENLRVSFDGFEALNISHFALEEGELRVIIGPNGAGKTTFLDVLCGKTKPKSGSVVMDGKEITRMSEKQIVQLGIGRKFQTPSVFTSLTVFENLLLAVKTDKSVFSTLFFKVTKGIKEKIASVAHTVGLQDKLDVLAGSLSHGQKQWLEIAIVILQEPKVLLIDEPAAGMSDKETDKTGELLIELSKEHSIIVIEHDMEFVRQIANKVTVFAEGKLLMEGSMKQVQNDPRVIERYLGKRNREARTEKELVKNE